MPQMFVKDLKEFLADKEDFAMIMIVDDRDRVRRLDEAEVLDILMDHNGRGDFFDEFNSEDGKPLGDDDRDVYSVVVLRMAEPD